MRRANLEDVARLAGVSTAVVSYVLNDGPRGVAPATRDRVLAAMDQLSYRPNASARALRLARTNVIALLIRDIMNPYFSELAMRIHHHAHGAGLGVMIGNTGRDDVEETVEFQNMLARGVDGVAMYGIRRAETLAAITRAGVRVVSLDWNAEASEIPSLGIDDYGAAELAVTHLLEHGFADVGLITGRDGPDLQEQAWADVIGARTGPGRLMQLRVHGDYTLQGGYDAALALLQLPTRPRAIFATSDVQAFGAIRAIQHRGLSIPDDIAIVSIDGTEASAFAFPSLTVVQLPLDQIAEFVVDQLTSASTTLEHRRTFEHHLVRRESCGCLPKVSAD